MSTLTLRPVLPFTSLAAGSDSSNGTATAVGSGAIGDQDDGTGVEFTRDDSTGPLEAIVTIPLEAAPELAGVEPTEVRVYMRAIALPSPVDDLVTPTQAAGAKNVQVQVNSTGWWGIDVQVGNDGTSLADDLAPNGPNEATYETYRSLGIIGGDWPAVGTLPGGFGDILAGGAPLRIRISDVTLAEVWVEVDSDLPDVPDDVELWPLHQRQRGITGLQQRKRHDW